MATTPACDETLMILPLRLRDHLRRQGLRQQIGCAQVDGDRLLPVRQRRFQDRRDARNAGVVDQNVHRAKRIKCSLCRVQWPFCCAHIGLDHYTAAPGCLDLRCRRVQALTVTPGNGDIRPSLRQYNRGLRADTLRAARHQDALAPHRKACSQRG
jgi:hypothetical protein